MKMIGEIEVQIINEENQRNLTNIFLYTNVIVGLVFLGNPLQG
jgi:hypothetical protein